jgi:hypothetical protein
MILVLRAALILFAFACLALDSTEQEYRERGYVPAFDKMPMLIIQRLSPMRVPVPNEDVK